MLMIAIRCGVSVIRTTLRIGRPESLRAGTEQSPDFGSGDRAGTEQCDRREGPTSSEAPPGASPLTTGMARALEEAVSDDFRYSPTDLASPVKELTPREKEVLGLVAQGLTDQVVATTLIISVHTVKQHLANIFDKLGVRTRTAAAHSFLTREH